MTQIEEHVKSHPNISEFETYHSACFDAFMTGFIFAFQLHKHDLTEEKNKIYLIGKQIPLKIESSRYAKPSAQAKKKLLI